MKCSHGGCQTDAVVLITQAAYALDGNWEPIGTARVACRFHMATVCEEHHTSLVSTLDP
jgi:hypothetical protein